MAESDDAQSEKVTRNETSTNEAADTTHESDPKVGSQSASTADPEIKVASEAAQASQSPNPESEAKVSNGTVPPVQAPGPETQSFDFGMKKKKKKVLVTSVPKSASTSADDEARNSATLSGGQVDQSAKDQDSGVQASETAPDSERTVDSQLKTAFKDKKKRRKTNLADFESRLQAEEGIKDHNGQGGGPLSAQSAKVEVDWISSDRDYTYEELLDRIFKILHQNNLELTGEKKYTIAPPQVTREGTKKSVFSNIVDICKAMHRQADHVIQYLFSELGTTGSIDSSQRLVIKGRFQQKQIESVLKRYFADYVSCKTCKSADTILTKENRLFFVQCESCGSSRSVSAIKTGFVAQTQKRSAQRAAAGS